MSWPALGDALPPRLDLRVERGIWGKMHAMPTDYRWIGRSRGLPPASTELELLLVVGPESAPVAASLWRSHDTMSLAAATYMSPARDAAGRSGFLEKQVLVLDRRADVPAALAAFALLPAARRRTSAEWWDRRVDARWQERDFHLVLEDGLQLSITAGEFEEGIGKGLEQLAAIAAGAPEKLRDVYASVLSSRKPAYLESMPGPLSAEATAALLLPVPHEVADRLSVAGWSLSTRYRRQRREVPWDIIALDRVSRDEGDAGPASVPVSSEALRRAEEIVQAIANRDPGRLRAAEGRVSEAVPVSPPPAAEAIKGSEPSQVEAAAPIVEVSPAEDSRAADAAEEPAFDSGGSEIIEATETPPAPPPHGERRSSSEWEELCRNIQNRDVKMGLLEELHAPLLDALPPEVSKLLRYACDSQFLYEDDLALPSSWGALSKGDPALDVLRAAVHRQKEEAKANQLRAALLVLDGSLGPEQALQICAQMGSGRDSRAEGKAWPLMFYRLLDSEAKEQLEDRLRQVWGKIPR